MIKFNINQLSVEIVRLKTVTTALGGSITVVDESKTNNAKETYRRIPVPLATARAFIIATKKITRYLNPVYVALAWYGDMVISMERHPLAGLGTLMMDSVTGPKMWEPDMSINLDTVILPMVRSRDWYFDGRYMFTFANECIDTMIRDGDHLTADGSFRKVVAQTVDLQCLHTKKDLSIEDRGCLAFVSSQGDSSVSPPIWKNLEKVGSKQMSVMSSMEDDDADRATTITSYEKFPFDSIDKNMSVNLNFALRAGIEIGKLFGYDQVEPLQLARLMIELRTVNLPNIDKSIKATYDIGMKFSHALAWLLGMSRYANTLDTYLIMRSLLTYLTRKGIFRQDTFNADCVFKDAKTVADIPLVDLTAARAQWAAAPVDFATLVASTKANRRS